MSLATRCTSCGTVFRVVQDQLKVSEGWVRCGKCSEVFNALEGLFDLERDGLPTRPSQAGALPDDAADSVDPNDPSEPAPFVEEPEPGVRAGGGSGLVPSYVESDPPPPPRSVEPAAAEEPVSASGRPDFVDARFDSEFDPEAESDAPAPALRAASAPDSLLESTLEQSPSEFVESMLADESAAPAFVRHAERRARWHDPRVRASLGVAALLLALLAAVQGMHHFRDLIAASWPGARAAMFGWCSMVGCRIEPVRRIEDISVESTALTRSPAPDAFALSVTLRNHAAIGLATPAIELTLKEGEQAFARRVLVAEDFRTPMAVLPAHAESTLQLLLSAGNPRVNGYSVEIFYP